MALSTIVSGGLGLADTLGFSLDDVFGGDDCTPEKEAARDQMKDDIQQYLTIEDRRNLVRNMDSQISATPGAIASFYFGGKDCKHKNVGSRDREMLDSVRPLIEQRKAEQRQQATASSFGGGSGGSVTGFQFPQWIFFGLVALVLGYLVSQ